MDPELRGLMWLIFGLACLVFAPLILVGVGGVINGC